MNTSLETVKKSALAAARKGNVETVDEIELNFIKANVGLYSPDLERGVRAQCCRLCRGASKSGETLLEWRLPNNDLVYSDLEAHVLPEYEEAISSFTHAAPDLVLEVE